MFSSNPFAEVSALTAPATMQTYLVVMNDWHCFMLSLYDRHSGDWHLEKAPVCHIVG